MARTSSTQRLPIGSPAPAFSLPDALGKVWTLSDLAERKPLVVVFACNHCPYVIHVRTALGTLAEEFQKRGVSFVAINSNDSIQYPDDAPDKMPAFAKAAGWNFPYLVDATQEVARQWHAACTPDFFLLDASGKLAYAGQFDPSRPKSETPVTGEDLRRAIEAVLSNQPIPSPQIPSLGCNIKWKPGNEPKA
ncbi:MAG: thioredoxin family protein [Verrucomicrobia bacterium]|nr:thioredoxin family protein [Verrucomicrobiota bacterium]